MRVSVRQSWSNNCGMAVISLGSGDLAQRDPFFAGPTMCRGPRSLPRSCKSPKLPIYGAGPGVATDAKSNEITAICLTDTLIKCGGHEESVDVVGIHLIRFGRVQNQYRPPGLCVAFRDGISHRRSKETADKVFCEGGPRSFPVCYLGNCLLRRVHEDLPSSPGAVAKAD